MSNHPIPLLSWPQQYCFLDNDGTPTVGADHHHHCHHHPHEDHIDESGANWVGFSELPKGKSFIQFYTTSPRSSCFVGSSSSSSKSSVTPPASIKNESIYE